MGLHKDVNMSENHVLVDYRDIKECPNILLSTAIMKLLFYVFMKNKTSMRFIFLYDFIHPLKSPKGLQRPVVENETFSSAAPPVYS